MTSARAQRGTSATELSVLAPLLMVFIGALIFAGRYSGASGGVADAATAAARAASLQRTAAAATVQARDVAGDILASQNLRCLETDVVADVAQFSRPPGMPARTEVTVRCRVDLAELVPGMPGSTVLTQSASSALDTYRGRS